MQLTPPDEFFNHQVALPHSLVGNSDPNWRERYWLSLQDVAQQRFIVSLGLGKYPNQDLMEGFVIARAGSRQHNLRVSRQLLPASDRMQVGPIRVEVVKPLETLRITIDANPSAVHGEFLWQAAASPLLEGRHFEVNRGRVSHDLVRYVQLGSLAGELTIGDERFELDAASTWSQRDHSWGTRPMMRVDGEPPPASVPWNFLAFCPLRFPSFVFHLYLFEQQLGRPTHLSAALLRTDGTRGDDEIRDIEHRFVWDDAAPVRTLRSGTLRVVFLDGRRLEIELQALAPRVYLKGGGYGVDQGRWKGENHLEHEVWDLDDASQIKDRAHSSSDHMVQARCQGETGYGVIEYIVRPGHEAYGRRR